MVVTETAPPARRLSQMVPTYPSKPDTPVSRPGSSTGSKVYSAYTHTTGKISDPGQAATAVAADDDDDEAI